MASAGVSTGRAVLQKRHTQTQLLQGGAAISNPPRLVWCTLVSTLSPSQLAQSSLMLTSCCRHEGTETHGSHKIEVVGIEHLRNQTVTTELQRKPMNLHVTWSIRVELRLIHFHTPLATFFHSSTEHALAGKCFHLTWCSRACTQRTWSSYMF